MPRFFFHIHNGKALTDHEGTDFPSAGDAVSHAVITMGEMLREQGGRVLNATGWAMDVVDEENETVCRLLFKADCRPIGTSDPFAMLGLTKH